MHTSLPCWQAREGEEKASAHFVVIGTRSSTIIWGTRDFGQSHFPILCFSSYTMRSLAHDDRWHNIQSFHAFFFIWPYVVLVCFIAVLWSLHLHCIVYLLNSLLEGDIKLSVECKFKMCYYSAIENNEIMFSATKWSQLETIRFNKIKQPQKD